MTTANPEGITLPPPLGERPIEASTLIPGSTSPLVETASAYLTLYQMYAQRILPQVHSDYHLLTALVIQAALLGHKIRTTTGLHMNLAGLIVTISGIGKSASTNIGHDLLSHLHKQGILIDSPLIATHATVEGLLEALQAKPSGIMDLDEFSAFLKDCQRDHMTSAKENFCRALDCRPIRYMRARGKNVIVPEPCPSVLGTVNIAPLRAASSIDDLVGGLFSRFLIVAPDFDFRLPEPTPPDPALQDAVLAIMTRWAQMDQQVVEIQPDLSQMFYEYAYSVCPYAKDQHIDLLDVADDASAAYIRYGTHALKVAVLLAAGETPMPNQIHVSESHANDAIELVERFRKYAERIFGVLSDADDTRILKRIEKILKREKRMTISELHQKIGGKTKSIELKGAVDTLIEWGSVKSGDRPSDLIWVSL